MSTTAEQQRRQLAEYESQLSDVNALISSGGEEDSSLTSLKSDLLELIALTRAELSELGGDAGGTIPTSSATTTDTSAAAASARLEDDGGQPVTTSAAAAPAEEEAMSLRKTDDEPQQQQPHADTTETAAAAAAAAATTETKKSKKKSSKSSDKDKPPSKFEIPPHLIPLESDTEPQRKQKRRTIKALKRKWKERVREVELGEKRNTWQSFVGGGGSSKRKAAVTAVSARGSIFATPEDGVGAKIGVVGGGRGMTDYAKRSKHG